MDEECTGIAVCMFVGSDPRIWTVEAREFGADDAEAAERFAASERARGGRVVVVTRRFTSRAGTTQRSEWRVGSQVIVESEDFGPTRSG